MKRNYLKSKQSSENTNKSELTPEKVQMESKGLKELSF
jgi:hypothetical protein